MAEHPFGNDPAKVARYRAFWQRASVSRPLVGFTLRGWFPLEENSASAAWQQHEELTPDMVHPEAFLDDEERLLREGELLHDDIFRGASPSQAVPWLDGMLGSRLRILPSSILGEERTLPWETLEHVGLDREHPWFSRYIAVIEALVERSAGRFPVSHGTLHGPSDMAAALRGHGQHIMDLMFEPERTQALLWRMAEVFGEITNEAWQRIPPYHGGYFDAQYQLWAPGSIIRMQEDASALYSPDLYRRFLQPIDCELAGRFACPFMHLHTTSMHLLDAFLEIEPLRCFELNYEVATGGPPAAQMVPLIRTMQQADRSVLIRGSFTADELRLLVDALDPRGLYLLIMVQGVEEAEALRPVLGM